MDVQTFIRRYWIGILYILLAGSVFSDFIVTAIPPFPGNYLNAWFEPWKSEYFINDTITLAHKPIAEDVIRHIVPFKVLGADMLSSLQLPLWNPYNGAGMPLLATINSGFLDLTVAFYMLFSDSIAYGLQVVFQFLIIGLALYWYLRSLSVSRYASLFGSLVYVFSGFTTIRLVFTTYGVSIAAVPLLFLLIERIRVRKQAKAWFFVPPIIAWVIVSSQTQVALYVVGIVSFYAGMRLSKVRALKIIGLIVLGFAMAAVQLAVTYELMQFAHITPGGSSDVIEKFSAPLEHLITIAIPNFYGSIVTYNYWGLVEYTQSIAYVGILPVFLSLIALRVCPKRLRRIVAFFIFIAGASVLFTLDWVGSDVLYSLPIPIISTGAPVRLYFLTTIAISISSAIGFDGLLLSARDRTVIVSGIATSILVGALLAGTYYMVYSGAVCRIGAVGHCWHVTFRNTLFATGVYGIQVLAIGGFFIVRQKNIRTLSIWVCIGITAVSGMYNMRKYLPSSPSKDLFIDLPVIEALREYTTDARVFGIGDAMIPSNVATHLRVYDPTYYHPLYILRYRELLEYANSGEHRAEYHRGDATIAQTHSEDEAFIARRERLLDLLSVRYRLYKQHEIDHRDIARHVVWEDDTWLLTATDTARPRAYAISKTETYQEKDRILSRLFDPAFDSAHTAIVESPIALDTDPLFTSDVRVKTYNPHRVVIATDMSDDALVVLTDNYYPGWHAYIDGERNRVYRTNYTFRGVLVPSGTHTVEYRYEPRSVAIGSAISASAFILWALLWIRLRKKA